MFIIVDLLQQAFLKGDFRLIWVMQQEKKLNLLSIRRRYVLLLKTVVVTPLEISEGRGKMC